MSDTLLTYNKNLINHEKNLKNRINKKYGKLLKHLSETKLHFDNLSDEIKFLNQLYFLHQSLHNVENNIDDTLEILKNVRHQENIEINFKEKISEDNWNQEIVNKLSGMVFLNS
jgi:hypothetical protein